MRKQEGAALGDDDKLTELEALREQIKGEEIPERLRKLAAELQRTIDAAEEAKR